MREEERMGLREGREGGEGEEGREGRGRKGGRGGGGREEREWSESKFWSFRCISYIHLSIAGIPQQN